MRFWRFHVNNLRPTLNKYFKVLTRTSNPKYQNDDFVLVKAAQKFLYNNKLYVLFNEAVLPIY